MKTKHRKSHRQERGNIQLFIFLCLLLLLLIQTAILWRNGTLPNLLKTTFPSLPVPSSQPSGPTPTPTPITLRRGPVTSNVGYGNDTKGPLVTKLFVSENDPRKGEQQTIRATIAYSSPIVSANATIQTDTGSASVPLTRTTGSETNGDWEGTWTVDATLLYKYIIYIEARAADGTSNNFDFPKRNP